MRPCFPRLYGNDGTKNRIGKAILEDRLPHALLLDGADGSGKTTLAYEIAAALNCEHRRDTSFPLPCGSCNSCRRIYEGGFVDVKHLKRRQDKATVGVEEVRELRNDMFLSSTESDYKVYIIDEAEKLTVEAQNSMLINLEEPPKGVVIILLANGTDRILTTIKSRTQYISMSRFTAEEIYGFLKNGSKLPALLLNDSELIRQASVGADGRIGEALRLTDPRSASDYKDYRERVIALVKTSRPGAPYSEVYAAISDLPTKRQEIIEVLEGFVTAIGDMIAAKRGDRPPVFFTKKDEPEELIPSMSFKRLLALYDTVNSTHVELSRNANVTSTLTAMAMKIKAL